MNAALSIQFDNVPHDDFTKLSEWKLTHKYQLQEKKICKIMNL